MGVLDGKTAIVTGSSRGIGRSVAITLASEGASVVLTGRDTELLAEVSNQIAAIGSSSVYLPGDLRREETASLLVDAALLEFGSLDIVVNNAGATKRGDFVELTEQDWADGFALKFFGGVRLCRAAWRSLKQSSGSVVNIGGVGGRTPGPDFSIGGSVNAAILSFTKALADTGIRDGIQVNAINPGSVRTARLSFRLEQLAESKGISLNEAEQMMISDSKVTRIGLPEDIANLTAFIVSPAGRFLQGALIDIDGGQTKTI
jgi:3-oxoacyl-[acyl-carrier protein] reductase